MWRDPKKMLIVNPGLSATHPKSPCPRAYWIWSGSDFKVGRSGQGTVKGTGRQRSHKGEKQQENLYLRSDFAIAEKERTHLQQKVETHLEVA